jgi:hypothetical protein
MKFSGNKLRVKFDLNPTQIELMGEALNNLLWQYGADMPEKKANPKLSKEVNQMISQFRNQTKV